MLPLLGLVKKTVFLGGIDARDSLFSQIVHKNGL